MGSGDRALLAGMSTRRKPAGSVADFRGKALERSRIGWQRVCVVFERTGYRDLARAELSVALTVRLGLGQDAPKAREELADGTLRQAPIGERARRHARVNKHHRNIPLSRLDD